MRAARALAPIACLLVTGCRYTWGIEHMPLLNGPGPRSTWLHVRGGGVVYDVDVHFPKSVPSSAPFVIVLHGSGGTGPGMERRTGLSAIADSAGFVVAYPDAQKNTQGRRNWTGADAGSPDIQMLRALIDSVSARMPIDRRRIYLAGFSNGGMMTYRAAMILDGTFAAVGVVAGALSVNAMQRAADAAVAWTPVPLVAVHGMLDDNVSYSGNGAATGRLGAPESVRTWARRNGCSVPPRTDTLDRERAVRTSYTKCRDDATTLLYSTTSGVHGWPNAGTHEAPLATSDILWRFFSEHRANDSLVMRDRRP